jgi:predicted cobalt transporter CbtA
MSRDRTKKIATLAGLALSAFGGIWAMALVAAHLVFDPHVARASERVKIMCAWAKMADDYAQVQNANTTAICEVVGARCLPMPPRPRFPLLDNCETP